MQGACVIYLLYLSWKIAHASTIPNTIPNTMTSDIQGVDAHNATGTPMTFIQAAAFQWVNPKAWAMGLTAISVYTSTQSNLLEVLLVATVFGVVNLPACFCWVVLGTQLRRILNNPLRLRLFNYTCAVLLVGSLYPILFSTLN